MSYRVEISAQIRSNGLAQQLTLLPSPAVVFAIDLTGKLVIITGGGRGLGIDIAKSFAEGQSSRGQSW